MIFNKLLNDFKKTKWYIIIIMGLIIFPVLYERILYLTERLGLSNFSKNEWFSFMGSYSGTIFAFVIMYITFYQTRKQSEKELRREKENYEIMREREIISKLKDIVMLDKYDFVSGEFPEGRILELCADLLVTKVYLSQIELDKEDSSKNKLIYKLKFLETTFQSVAITLEQVLNAEQKSNEKIEKIQKTIMGLQKLGNTYKTELTELYLDYENEIKNKMFGR